MAAIQVDNNNNPVPLVSGQPVYLPVGNIKQQLVLGEHAIHGAVAQGRVSHRDAVHANGPDHHQ